MSQNFGMGRFMTSATQEEILQVCCPEFSVGMLFVGSIAEDEVVNVHGCRRYCSHRGYQHTFECAGPADGARIQSILVLDACTSRHWTPPMVVRDVRKAYTSFAALASREAERRRKETAYTSLASARLDQGLAGLFRPLVSTGRWGCGTSGGHPSHKLLQQAVAAALSGVDLAYSAQDASFGTADNCPELLDVIRSERLTVAQAWALLRTKGENRRRFENELGLASSSRRTSGEHSVSPGSITADGPKIKETQEGAEGGCTVS